MGVLIMIGQVVLALSLLVAIHELGHYLAARAFGIRVDKFYVFFDAWGKKLWSKKFGQTEWGIGWLPLGGYVKIAGMIDESMDKDQMAQAPKPDEFRAKPAWQRFIVMIAGIVMNVILAIILFMVYIGAFEKSYLSTETANETGLYVSQLAYDVGMRDGDKLIAVDGKSKKRFGDMLSSTLLFAKSITVERDGQRMQFDLPQDFYQKIKAQGLDQFVGLKEELEIGEIVRDESRTAGLRVGDKLISINDKPLGTFLHLSEYLQASKSSKAKVELQREGKTMTLNIPVDSNGTMGILALRERDASYKVNRYNFGEVIKYGFKEAYGALTLQIKGFGAIFAGKESVKDSLGGPIMIAEVYGSKWDWARFIRLTALISMVLAFMNLLPIPALDGGHIFFIGVEAIMGRKLSDSFMEKAQMVGMIILLTLTVLIFGNDIARLLR